MIIRCFLLLFSAVFAQIPPQPVVTTNSACLNDCLQQGSLVFVASNLRNFQKIVLNIEQFCNTYNQLMKCAQSCTDEDRQNLVQRTVLSAYICKDKLEEFRLVKECVENQQTDNVNQCADNCGHPSTATLQLDSTPAAAVNPFSFFDSITPVCRTIECVIKCAVTESNKKCAGSGDLFRDIGLMQVMEASERLHNDLFNSSSTVTQQLTKIYLEALPEQCAYIINPIKYEMIFVIRDQNEDREAATVTVNESSSSATGETGTKLTTAETFSAIDDDVITRIFDIQIESKTTEASSTPATDSKETEQEAQTTTVTVESEKKADKSESTSSSSTENNNEPAQPEKPVQIQIQPVPPQTDVEHITEQDEQMTTEKEATASPGGGVENKEETGTEWPHEKEETKQKSSMSSDSDESSTLTAVHKSNESEEMTAEVTENIDLQHVSTTATAPETERTIMVVNEENEQEIETNMIHPEHNEPQHQKDLKKSTCGRTALSLIMLLPLLLVCFPSQ